MIQVLFLWLFLCPILIGTSYHYFFFAESIPVPLKNVDFAIGSCWLVGFLIIHAWAILCYNGAFTHDFWRKVRQLAIDGIAGGPPAEGNNNRRRVQQRQQNDVARLNDEAP